MHISLRVLLFKQFIGVIAGNKNNLENKNGKTVCNAETGTIRTTHDQGEHLIIHVDNVEIDVLLFRLFPKD